jgi:hypothetical protein
MFFLLLGVALASGIPIGRDHRRRANPRLVDRIRVPRRELGQPYRDYKRQVRGRINPGGRFDNLPIESAIPAMMDR